MSGEQIQLRIERQLNPIADEVSAIAAVVCPILEGVLYAIKGEFIQQVGGHENVNLAMLTRLYRPGDGDCGICFEYAVHDAIRRGDPLVLEKITRSMVHCRVPGSQTASILFGAEKSGAVKLIDTAQNLLTPASRLLSGKAGSSIKLQKYLPQLASALRSHADRENLPTSIRGLWKADLFLGNRDSDRWVGTTVKINPAHLEAAPGLRIAIIPSQTGKSDAVRFDDAKNLIICPLPYDAAFVELFYSAWSIIKQFINAGGHLPDPSFLPVTSHRMVAKWLHEWRDYPVMQVVQAIRAQAQPYLLDSSTQEKLGDVIEKATGGERLDTIIAPVSQSRSDTASG